ncbi:MAG: vitamin K epoxide reductase family protein [Synechococcales cyanobacterium K44_A2020_017]|nr:vitamin K epoxide reductase family protein [Synechococcales cyanobacterium K32_A2020_035]MBF2095139.1 vitamin K epoxide reductase family protein [Synechococcales cyanobacterium K44_A2020_017]
MSRRSRRTPWLHRWSRYIITAIACVGAIVTGWLTYEKLTGGTAACPTEGCTQVLSSPYAEVFGIPLTIFGLLAYLSMGAMAIAPTLVNPETNKDLRMKLEGWTWPLLFMGATAMTIFSGYLMYVLAFELQTVCVYCISSATFSLSFLVLTLLGRAWDDAGKLIFIGIIVAMVTLIGTLGVYAGVNAPAAENDVPGEAGPRVTTTSGNAELALAAHLSSIGAKMYGAYWCPHCHDQKQLFGLPAAKEFPYVECAPDGQNPQTDLCQSLSDQVTGFPTWEINGQYYPGTRSLQELAQLSGYSGPTDFAN